MPSEESAQTTQGKVLSSRICACASECNEMTMAIYGLSFAHSNHPDITSCPTPKQEDTKKGKVKEKKRKDPCDKKKNKGCRELSFFGFFLVPLLRLSLCLQLK